jgi:hypothetical protein
MVRVVLLKSVLVALFPDVAGHGTRECALVVSGALLQWPRLQEGGQD